MDFSVLHLGCITTAGCALTTALHLDRSWSTDLAIGPSVCPRAPSLAGSQVTQPYELAKLGGWNVAVGQCQK